MRKVIIVSERVQVVLDARVRVATAVLAVSAWPAMEQAIEPHAVHMQSKLTRQFLRDKGLAEHLAVLRLNGLLEVGVPLGDVFTAVLCASWPDWQQQYALPNLFSDIWFEELADFTQQSQIFAELWAEQSEVWAEALDDLEQIYNTAVLSAFMTRLLGRPISRPMIIVPTLVFPMLTGVAVSTAVAHYVILPPPKAWGESPPWPYRDGTDWSLGEACRVLTKHLLAREIADFTPGQCALLQHAAATIFLGEALSPAEEMSYLVRAKRQYKLPQLPAVVQKLRPWLDAREGSLADVLAV